MDLWHLAFGVPMGDFCHCASLMSVLATNLDGLGQSLQMGSCYSGGAVEGHEEGKTPEAATDVTVQTVLRFILCKKECTV